MMFRFGSWAFPTGLVLVGVGAGVAALNEFKGIGITVMIVGSVLSLVGLVAFVFGLWSYLKELKAQQGKAEAREAARDERDIQGLEIQRQILGVQRQRLEAQNALATATNAEERSAARESTVTALAVEKQALNAERVKQVGWLKVARDYKDERRTQILEAELEINELRTSALERDLEVLRAQMPDEDQRKREAVKAVGDSITNALLGL